DQAQDRECADRLARAAFPDDGDGFAWLNGVRNSVHRADRAGPGAELRVQVSDIQERRHTPPDVSSGSRLLFSGSAAGFVKAGGQGCQRRLPHAAASCLVVRGANGGIRSWRTGKNSMGGWRSSPARRATSAARSPTSWRRVAPRSWLTPAPAR